MVIKYFPNEESVKKAMQDDDPLLMLVSFDGGEILLSHVDDAVEHVILLRKKGYRETDMDRFFRIVLDREGADWTFVCPEGYKSIENKDRRIAIFFKDGIEMIGRALSAVGYEVEINIPKRYRRHFNMLQ